MGSTDASVEASLLKVALILFVEVSLLVVALILFVDGILASGGTDAHVRASLP